VGSLHHCFLLRSATTPPIAPLAMSNDRNVSSGRLWRTFHVQSPSRLGKAHLYLASGQPVEPPIPASTHLLRKSGQKQGFITRIEAEPNDKIAGDRCDFFSRRIKEWQSHRGARCNSRFVKARRRSASASRSGSCSPRSFQIDHRNNPVFTKQIEHGFSRGLFHQRHKCLFDFWITIRDPRDGADFVSLLADGPSSISRPSLLWSHFSRHAASGWLFMPSFPHDPAGSPPATRPNPSVRAPRTRLRAA
jgi:hypothetical protein